MIAKMWERVIFRLSRRAFDFVHAWKAGLFPGQNVFSQKCDRVGLVNFSLGRHSYANGVSVYGWQKETSATVAAFCSIAEDVVFLAGGEHDYRLVSSSPFISSCLNLKRINSKGNICVGNDVWIGHGAILLSGIKVGDGAVIAAGAVVAKDVAPYTIVGGIPAKTIKLRFSPEICEALLRIKWWEWEDTTIVSRARDFLEVSGFVEKYDPQR
jgi:acetyltransferase-like isoleucine patch superfamily enzyme